MKKRMNVKWQLIAYDAAILLTVHIFLLVLYGGPTKLSMVGVIQQSVISFICDFTGRFIGNIYRQI